jgi:hypothetical protein
MDNVLARLKSLIRRPPYVYTVRYAAQVLAGPFGRLDDAQTEAMRISRRRSQMEIHVYRTRPGASTITLMSAYIRGVDVREPRAYD